MLQILLNVGFLFSLKSQVLVPSERKKGERGAHFEELVMWNIGSFHLMNHLPEKKK